ncbi:hypothetical protein Vau01_013700 [Virgisporangium aurantiacum]|uniref:Uncharacterized protein n=1 Tax=Virgisporangium aurantiacum TaxID=175570 RepID=A0A8J3YXK9_9ACTN|nr:hypothetical protein Vau01_013700 [Virgisporangium aurantiacum]
MARRILRLLGSRYGLAVIGVVLVVIVVGVARVISGPQPFEAAGPPPPLQVSASSSEILGDDSVATTEDSPSISAIPGVPAPEKVALDFANAWVKSTGMTSAQWVKSLEPYSTKRLLEQFKDVDPTSVPAESVRGPATVRPRDSQLAEVDVPVTPGTLKLRLLVSNGRWLVDAVSWERS